MNTSVIDVRVWEPDPEHEGFVRLARIRTIGEVHRMLCDQFGREGAGHSEYFSVSLNSRTGERRYEEPFPGGQIVVFARRGQNEGHLVDVGVISAGGRFDGLMMAKTFDGYDAACDFAREVGRALGGE